VKKNIFATFPPIQDLIKKMNGTPLPPFREVNGHIHSPYSFSAFKRLEIAFEMAKEESIAVLGINDFFVTDGYETFYNGSLRNNIFPLFNLEFIGLLKNEQKNGIRINDPNNPGRIYFSGKGLDYPFELSLLEQIKMKMVIIESQKQMKSMIKKLNELILPVNSSITLKYETIRERFAEDLVRERHLAKAVRVIASEKYKNPDDQIKFIESLYGGKKSKASIENAAAIENEIRANLLKSGGAAFVEENRNSFLELKTIIRIIHKSGGIPCYPVLLDDPSGKFTEFEADAEKLYEALAALNIGCIELIPGRNDHAILKKFVDYFNEKGFVIIFGTEHNTPEMTPLKVTARGSQPLDDSLKQISWEGACVIAAHQYLRAHHRQGFVLEDGSICLDQKKDLIRLGHYVIEYYLNKNNKYNGSRN